MLLLLLALVPVGLRAATVVTVTCYDGTNTQQVSDVQNAACSLFDPNQGMASASGAAAAGGLNVSSNINSLYSYPYATATASWDVVFPTAEMLTWQVGWSYFGDYSFHLDLGGQAPPLGQWFSANLSSAVWNQIVSAGEYTFSASSQDYGEGAASLTATLLSATPVPSPEPGTGLSSGVLAALFGLLAAARRLTVKIRWERSRSSRAIGRPAGYSVVLCTRRCAPG